MDIPDVLTEVFGRVREEVRSVLDGIDPDHLTARADPTANTVAWLVWHLTRVQDDHVAEVAGTEQVWMAEGWADRFDLALDGGDTGYGHDADQVAAVAARAEDLLGYHEAVHQATLAFVSGLDAEALDRVVDQRWDPPVTLGVRLVSVAQDDLEHVGQAAYARGLAERA
jgi:uncharacterized damage-inducible protein DinB